MDESLYTEGAGPATWAVVILSLIAAVTSGAAWVRHLSASDSAVASAPGGAVPSAVAAVVALMVGLVGIDALVRRKLVLTRQSLQVGRETVPLRRLAQPVLTGDRLPDSIRGGGLARNALPPGCRAIGNLANAGVGQQPVAVVSSEPREILVVYSWRPQEFAEILGRELGSDDEDAAASGDWL